MLFSKLLTGYQFDQNISNKKFILGFLTLDANLAPYKPSQRS
jgi:hypothetical protein